MFTGGVVSSVKYLRGVCVHVCVGAPGEKKLRALVEQVQDMPCGNRRKICGLERISEQLFLHVPKCFLPLLCLATYTDSLVSMGRAHEIIPGHRQFQSSRQQCRLRSPVARNI